MALPGSTPSIYEQGSPNQQSLVLDCSVCAEQYGPKFADEPRSLRCGHTFCTACLMRLISSRGIICPMCNQLHRLFALDVTLVPINYAVLEIVRNINAQSEVMNQQPNVPLCAVCSVNPTTITCVDCDPGNHYNFCEKCDVAEHTRGFAPVQRHKRFPIGDVPPMPSSSSVCPRHLVTATLFSEGLNEFACHKCQTEDDWQTRAVQFELLPEATEKLRVKIQKLNKYTSDMTYRLRESKMNLETIINDLEPGAVTVKAKITETFSKCVEVLQERQKMLLANVDVEVTNRKESLKKQHDAVHNASTKYRNAYQNLNSLIAAGADFIPLYRISFQDIESSLELDDKSLLRPVVNQEIPFCMSKDIEKQLRSLGAVGGGASPIELDFAASGAMGTLMQIYWQLPERCDRVHRFQIEYEQIVDSNIEHRNSGLVDHAGDKVYSQKDPQYYEVPGNELTAYVDYLCPGYTFRFRIRSANDAGFGMWSDPIVAETIGFPFTLEYTKRIHRIIIPSCNHYRITVKGAKAADGMMHKGGKGAIISAVVSLKAGNVLILLCGGLSSRHHYHSGGGGASFVALNEITQESLLIAAGGGGGTRGADPNDFDGSDANIYEDGFSGRGSFFGAGGKTGGPGEDAKDSSNTEELWSWGGGGAGFMQDSTTAHGFVAGGHGGQNGGFGGGGSVGMYGGGGGGGYSGGGGGRGGGGGGSYVISSAVEVSRSVGNDGHGSIHIEKVDPPYPISNSFSRGMSTAGGDTTSNSISATRLNDAGVPFDSQFSSSSFNTTRTTNSTSNGTSSVNIGTIPENESGSLHQSPASTGQVSTGQVDPLAEVTFTLEDPDEVSTVGPTVVSEVFTVAPTCTYGTAYSHSLMNTEVTATSNAAVQVCSEEPTNYSGVKKLVPQYQTPSKQEATMITPEEQSYGYPEPGVSNFMVKAAPSAQTVSGGDLQQRGVAQNLPNVSPPMTHQQQGGDDSDQSVESLQAQLQQMQQRLFQLQQQQQQQRQQSQPVHQVISLQRQNFSPPMTTQQQYPQTCDPAMLGQQLQQTEQQLLQLQLQQQQPTYPGVPQQRQNVSPPMSQYPQQEVSAELSLQPVHPGVPQQWQNISPPTTTQQLQANSAMLGQQLNTQHHQT